jgi:hypothetical protein
MYRQAMLTATKASMWRSRYDVSVDGRPLATWDGKVWKSGGAIELAGERYEVQGNFLGTTYKMIDATGATLATATRVGRKQWSVDTGRATYSFRRKSMWSSEQELLTGGTRVGSIRRTSTWRSDTVADLPGLPLPVQLFVLGVVISMWEAQQAAASG